MRKIGSITLLLVYTISLAQIMVPALSFHFNHEYVKTHLCRSLFEYGYDDCDGFCYLKKKVEQHHDDHHNMPEATPPKVPMLYVLKLIHDEYPSKPIIPEEPFLSIHDRRAHQFYADIILPPPKA